MKTTNLTKGAWKNLSAVIIATNSTASTTNATGSTVKCFRITTSP
jgi:hypothetical protein